MKDLTHSKTASSEPMRHPLRDPGGRMVSSADGLTGGQDRAIVGLWVALLLSVIGYALVEGEAVMAQLDGLDLVAAHSLAP